MHVLLTSAHGWVGSQITRLLLARGHTITGLARSSASAGKVTALGAEPLSLSLEDPQGIADFIKSSNVDAVIHTAFNHDFSKYIENIATDLAVIKAIGGALEGTDKPFISTFGISAPVEDQWPAADSPNPRGKSEYTIKEFADKGVKAMVVRLPPSVHGTGDYAFISWLIASAREKKVSAYIEGKGVWSAVHVKDAAQLYVDVLEKGKAGGRYHAIGDTGVPVKDIAQAIAKGLGVEAKAVGAGEIGQYAGVLTPFIGGDFRAEVDITKKELGWAPKEQGLLDDIEDEKSGYFAKK